jgi:hypothetical protein
MATRCACANGNFTAAATWALIEPISYLDTQATETIPGTTYNPSASFTPGAVIVDAILIKLATRLNNASNYTTSVRLATGGVLVAGTEITINGFDMPPSYPNTGAGSISDRDAGGWVLFKFPAPVTLLAATAYTVDVKCGAGFSHYTYYASASFNWARALRTTTTGAPAAGDDLIIVQEYTGPGTKNLLSVNMDSTTATDYGSARTSYAQAAVAICKGGTLNFDPTINSLLQLSGQLSIYSGGTLSIGTVATPIPTNKTATLQFDCAANGQFGLIAKVGSSVIFQGSPRTPGKNITWTKLTSNIAVAVTTANVANDTGWLAGDEIVMPSTSRVYTEVDRRTLSANAASGAIQWTAGTTYAHLGTSPAQGEAGLLTRNVTFRSAQTAFGTFFFCGTYNIIPVATVINLAWTAFRYMGVGGGTSPAGFYITEWENSLSFTMSFCSYYDNLSSSYGIAMDGAISGITVLNTLQDSVIYLTGFPNQSACYLRGVTAPFAVQRNLIIAQQSNGYGIYSDTSNSATVNAGNCVASCGSDGFYENRQQTFLGSNYHDNEAHSCFGIGVNLGSNNTIGDGSSLVNYKLWRNGQGNGASDSAGGLYIYNVTLQLRVTLINPILFGNKPGNMVFRGGGCFTIEGGVMAGDSTYPVVTNIYMDPSFGSTVHASYMNSVTFSKPTGGFLVPVTGPDISFYSSGTTLTWIRLHAENCWFGGAGGPIQWPTYMKTVPEAQSRMFLKSQYQNAITNNNHCYTPAGNVQTDTTIFNASAPSEAVLPTASATIKVRSGLHLATCLAGKAVNISCFVRKDNIYGGNFARLILQRQDSLGITADMILDTATVAENIWEQLIGSTPMIPRNGVLAFYVDCDGTSGQYNVDDWQAAST